VLSLQLGGMVSTLGIQVGAPVLAEMASASPAGLNSSANLAREAAQIPARVGISIVAHNFYYAGPFRAVWPEQGDWIASAMSAARATLNYFGSYIALTADPSDSRAANLVSWLWSASSWISAIDPTWCRYLSSASGTTCHPNDTVVPDWSQVYPGAPLIYIPREGPAHIRETAQSDDVLYTALTNFMHLRPRTGGGGGGGSSPPAANTLAGGQSLDPGKVLVSSDGRFRLAYQGDGNLVLYRWDGVPLWASKTSGTSPGRAAMQGDGNFVVYNGSGTPVWSSATAGNPGAYLKVQNDGNVVVYRSSGAALWSTGTCCY